MTTPPTGGEGRADRLDQILADYLAAEDEGRAPDPRELAARHPEFAAELGSFFAGNERLRRAAGPTPDETEAHVTDPTPDETEAHVTDPTAEATPSLGDGPGLAPVDPTRVAYFGDYTLIKTLGQGGMGIVYQARQISLDRPVALKMIRADRLGDDDEARRFRNEAEAVARLDHPNLLPILEIGEHQGRRYFSMPLVSGGSLADHLGRYRDDLPGAARLMVDVAEAIHHAHQRGILHRDLKPANVLLDSEGRPHVTDFGLAKRLADDPELTRSGAILGTPAYMAPEQAGGHREAVTTASDVYGLGAILYALLTGKSPFRGHSALETLRQVRESTPERPRALNRRVGRGLEMICLKCLEKDPRRRYASAAALAEDLRRWGRGEPVEARPAGLAVRLGLWCRRRPALAGLLALLAISVAAGAAGVFWQWREANHQREVARAVDGFFRETFLGYRDPMGYAHDRRTTVEELFDRAAAKIEAGYAGPPEVEAGVRESIGNTYHAMGRLAKAEPQLRRALELFRAALGRSAEPTLDCEQDYAALLLDMGRVAEAGLLAQEAYRLRRDRSGPSDRLTLGALATRARWELAAGMAVEAERSSREALAGLEKTLGLGDPRTLEAADALAITLQQRGKLDEAEALHRRALEGRQRIFPEDHPLVLESLNGQAACLIRQGKLGEAEPIIGEALKSGSRAGGERHPGTLRVRSNLAALLLTSGRLDDAERALRQVLELQAGVLPETHPDVLANLSNLATTQLRRGHPELAEPAFRQVLERTRAASGEGSFATARARFNLGSLLHDNGRYPEAAGLLDAALPAYRETLKPVDPDLASLLNACGSAFLNSGRPDRAEPLLSQALEIRQTLLLPGAWQSANTRSLLGGALAARGQPEKAEPLLVQALEALLAAPEAPKIRVAQARRRLVDFYESRGEPAKAERWKAPAEAQATPPR